jgi:hypothetical protein
MSKQKILSGKVPYNGPKGYSSIINKIHEDSNKSISKEFIQKVVRLFFTEKNGLFRPLKFQAGIKINKLGYFKVEKRQIERREAKRIKQKKKTNQYRSKTANLYYRKKRYERNLLEINKNRENLGMKPMDMDEYIKVTGKKLLKIFK